MSQTYLQMETLKSLAKKLQDNLRTMSPLNWIQYIILIAMVGLLIVLVIILFPCLLKCLFRSMSAVEQKVFKLSLKNKKRGTVTPMMTTPV